MLKKILPVLAGLLCGILCAAATEWKEFHSGDWTFSLDQSNGELRDIAYGGNRVFPKLSRIQSFAGQDVAAFTLKSYEFKEADRALTLHLETPEFELTETVRFDSHHLAGLLERSATLKFKVSQPTLFGSWTALARINADAEYFVPGAIFGDVRYAEPLRVATRAESDRSLTRGSLDNLNDGTVRKSSEHGGYGVILLQTAAGPTISVLNDERIELIHSSVVKENKKYAAIRQEVLCNGWALSDAEQREIGPVFLRVLPAGTMDDALAGIHDFYRVIGAVPPQDRPEWVSKQMVYEMNPAHGMGADNLELLANELLPRIAGMNFTLIYAQPIADGRGNYLPVNHRRLAPVVGTVDQYRDFLQQLKKHHLRVWQDIVPHGSAIKDSEVRGNSVFVRGFNANGQLNNYIYATDYMNPQWRDYMRETARFWMSELPLDGFRIDMPYGSPANFRRQGFPAQKPDQVSEEWWQRSLAETGGAVPALEYDRASRSSRYGGLEMVRLLRAEARKANPDAAVLAEVLAPYQSFTADVIYDLLYDLITYRARNLAPAEFVDGLSNFFYEQDKMSLPGMLWLREFQSHDAVRTWDLLGTGAGKCAYATCVLSKGLPLLDYNMDIGHGVFLSQIQGIRKERPELNDGDTDYLCVKTNPGVWAVLHQNGAQCTIGLANFNSQAQQCKVTVPVKNLNLPPGNYALINRMNGKTVACGTPEKLADFSLQLSPYEVAVLCSVSADTLRPATVPYVAPDYSGKVAMQEDSSAIRVTAPGYSAEFDRASGLLQQFNAPDGTELIRNADWLLGQAEKMDKAQLIVHRNDDNVVIEVTRELGDDTVLTSQYRCFADRIELSAKLAGNAGGEFVALALPMADYRSGSWRAATMDGLLDDRFWETILPVDRIAGLKTGSEYRDLSGTILWNSDTRIPDYANARCAMYGKTGQGFELFAPDALRSYPAMIQFRRRIGSRQQPGAVLYLRSPSELTVELPQTFHIVLRSADYRQQWPEFSTPVTVGGVTLRGASSDYVIENTRYRMMLRRQNGTIRELTDKSVNKIVLRDFFTRNDGENLHNQGDKYDTDASMRIFEQDGKLILRTSGDSRSATKQWGPAPQCHLTTEYVFDASDTIRSRRGLLLESPLTNQSYLLTGEIPSPLKGDADAQKMTVYDDQRLLLTILTAGYYNAYVTDGIWKLFAANRKHGNTPGQWQTFALDYCFGATGSPLPPLPPLPTKTRTLAMKLNFDISALAYSVREGKPVPYRLDSLYPSLFFWSPGSVVPFCGFDRKDTYRGKVSALLPGAWRTAEYAGDFTPWFRYPLPMLEPGQYRVRFAAKFENVKARAPLACHLSGYTRDGRFVSVGIKQFDIPENAAWQTYELEFGQPLTEELKNVTIYFGVNSQSTGFSRFSDIEVIRDRDSQSGPAKK